MALIFKKAFLFWFILLTIISANAAEIIKVGIYSDFHLQSVSLQVRHGAYSLESAGSLLASLKEGQVVSLIAKSNGVQVSVNDMNLGVFSGIAFKSQHLGSTFEISPRLRNAGSRLYDDDLIAEKRGSALRLINHVNLENYVAGVVEAETGKGRTIEFYKVQAILARTYALYTLKKTSHKDMNLNDLADYQVYLGKSRWDPEIVQATEETRGIVLADANLELIAAAYCSNSGGETVNAGDVWSHSVPYLKSRPDTFSIHGAHYHWEKMISRKTWLQYLSSHFGVPVQNVNAAYTATHFSQPTRKNYFGNRKWNVPLETVRNDFQLNSTYFDIQDKGDSLLFEGRGFGHGIGLSQEGAIYMAEKGYSYRDILFFYFSGVHLVEYDLLSMMRPY